MASRKLSRAVDDPYVLCVSIKLLVPLIHARDNGKTFLFNLSVILLGVVQPVRCESDRLIVL